MNHEFHFYGTYYLAVHAGFSPNDAETLANAAQMPDTCLVSYRVATGRTMYDTTATHHYGFWDTRHEWEIWIPFHFVPGDSTVAAALRKDGRKSAYAVTPNSENAKKLLLAALRTRDLFRLGIALHAFADTWAHQNFSGRNETLNTVDPNSVVPPIGHAHVRRAPDMIDEIWTDPRLRGPNDRIVNRRRFLDAARVIYKYLCTFNRRTFADAEIVIANLSGLLGKGKSNEEKVYDFVIECGAPEYRRNAWKKDALIDPYEPDLGNFESTYEKLEWLTKEVLAKAAISEKKPVESRPGFYSSPYYRWMEAAKQHRTKAREILAQLTSSART